MEMKKCLQYIIGGFIFVLCMIPNFLNAKYINIGLNEFEESSNNFWFNQSCDEVKRQEIYYTGDYGLYIDDFINRGDIDLYIKKFKVITSGNYLNYNKSITSGNQASLLIANKSAIPANGKILPGQRIRHLTTAEEVSGATFQYNWRFNSGFVASGMIFWIPNYRSNGTHPSTPTMITSGGRGDVEFRIMTLYSTSRNGTLSNTNAVLVECQENLIRRCGDGLLYTGKEQCDPVDPTHTNWGTNGCSNTCEPINNTVTPNTECNISLSTGEISEGGTSTINYSISGSYYLSAKLRSNPILSGFNPYNIGCNGIGRPSFYGTICGSRTGSVNVTVNTGGTYRFTITGTGSNGSGFICSTELLVRGQETNPDISIIKTLESTGVFESGDYVRYKILVSNSGDGTGYNIYIRDILPMYVKYVSSNITFNPTSSQTPNFGVWASGGLDIFEYSGITLNPGQQAIVILTGRIAGLNYPSVQQVNSVYSHLLMPCDGLLNDIVSDFYNLATRNCAYVSTGDDWTGSCVEFPVPYMIKYQSVRGIDFTRDDVIVAPGESITYKVDFGNETGSKMEDVVLYDIMPKCIDYLTSTVYGIDGYSFYTGINSNGQTVVYYSGFTLEPEQSGYMILTGVVSSDEMCQDTKRYKNDAYLVYSGGYINSSVIAKRPRIYVTKTGDGPHYNLNDTIHFFIDVINNGPEDAYDIVLTDVWPSLPENCVNYDGWTGTNGLYKSGDNLIRGYSGILHSGERLNLILSGRIGSDPVCITDYINVVRLTYTDGSGHSYTGDDDYPFDVTGSDNGYVDKTVDNHYPTENGIVTWTIRYGNSGSVDRDTGYQLVDTWPENYLDYGGSDCTGICSESRSGNIITFTFDSVLHPGETGILHLTGKVIHYPWNTTGRNHVTLKYHTIFGSGSKTDKDRVYTSGEVEKGYCGDGILQTELGEECDGGYDIYGWDNYRFYIWDHLDYWLETPAGIYAHAGYYCTTGCKLAQEENNVYSMPSCLGTDTAISAMENEKLPFWWRIWLRTGINFVESDSDSCTYNTTQTTIKKNSMTCYFTVYYGKNGELQKVKNFSEDCFKTNLNLSTYFETFEKNDGHYGYEIKYLAGLQAFKVSELINNNSQNRYGEYKLSLNGIDYQYCGSDGNWHKGQRKKDVCEVNFAVTDSYIVQTNTTTTNTTSNFLKNYYDMAGNKIIEGSDLEKIVKVNNSEFNFNTDVNKQIKQFKKKYEGLAVSTNTTARGKNVSVKKVPGKSIYFVSGKNGNNNLVITNSNVGKNPYTIVVSGMDVEISGSINTNGMIIADGGTIRFSDAGCSIGGQFVQGIFIATKGFEGDTSTQNTNINKPRCHRGNLHVKGVLIGNNIDNITKTKRSQLNSWFETRQKYEHTNELTTERMKEIFEGASLYIEYNPALWSNIIPGAEIFTETLDIYKK